MKKIGILFSALLMVFTLAACSPKAEKLVIWSFTDELQTEGDVENFKSQYTGEGQKYEGMEVEYVVIPTADYLSKILPVLKTGNGAPDVFTGELDMVQNFMEGGYLADLQSMIEEDEDLDLDTVKNDFQGYIWEAGIDPADNKLKALSWQVTPGGIFFKTDMAKAVWGNESGFPTETEGENYNTLVSDWVSENKFNSLESLVTSSQEVKAYNSNWRLFPDDQAIRHFAKGSDDGSSWLDSDGKISATKIEEQLVYMNTVDALYGESITESLTANAGEWSAEWFAGMGKEFEDAEGNKYQTMAYSLPTWGLFYVISPNAERVDANGDTCTLPESPTDADKEACQLKGNWGMASGPNSYFWGGTYLNIREDSKNKEAAYDFIKSMILDNEYLTKRAENGDVYAVNSVMDSVQEGFEGYDMLGGMNHYAAFLAEAEKISFDTVTKYDRQLDTLFGKYVTAHKKGESGAETLEEALNGFYDELKVTFNDIYRESGLPYQK